jgi:hypothetical protein
VTPVDTTWHFTTLLDLLDHWQTIIAGVLALFAALIAVQVTLQVERAKADREVAALRKSLAVELRVQVARALGVHASLQRLGSQPNESISARMVESLSRMPAPIIYTANAGKIGLLEGDAMNVVIVHTLLESAGDAAARLSAAAPRQMTKDKTPDDIHPAIVLSTAEAFLTACEYAREVLSKLRTGDASRDAKDKALIQQINAALTARQSRP